RDVAPEHVIAKARARFLLIHGTDDVVVPVSNAHRLAAAGDSKVQTWIIPGRGHSDPNREPAMAAQQERFFPYLTGYVALYLGNLPEAERDLRSAIGMRGNQRDPFMLCLLAMALEKEGKQDEANAAYRQAYDLAAAHNPPAAFVRPFVRKKLNLPL
ncbi:MAG TPA: hypothetical protein VMT21_09940, partial [Gemmatimonadales bacterium]|nr:hypothetical protein [Gemmatimonadales bacterium]